MTKFVQDPDSEWGNDRIALTSTYRSPSGRTVMACADLGPAAIPGYKVILVEFGSSDNGPAKWTVPGYLVEYKGWEG